MVQPPWCDLVQPNPNVPRERPDHPALPRSHRNAEEHQQDSRHLLLALTGHQVERKNCWCVSSMNSFWLNLHWQSGRLSTPLGEMVCQRTCTVQRTESSPAPVVTENLLCLHARSSSWSDHRPLYHSQLWKRWNTPNQQCRMPSIVAHSFQQRTSASSTNCRLNAVTAFALSQLKLWYSCQVRDISSWIFLLADAAHYPLVRVRDMSRIHEVFHQNIIPATQ